MDSQPTAGLTLAPGGAAALWESPTSKCAVYFDLDVVDRLNYDVMRGFGAIPRRGAEVGGILLGTIEEGDPAIIRIEDYVPVSCEHLRGPSFILSDADAARMEESLSRWRKGPDRRIYAIGLYRSNTREGILLGKEDFELLDAHFPEPFSVCLLIRPFATKPSQAAFVIREDGVFSTPSEPPCFPFRRRELGGTAPPGRAAGKRASLTGLMDASAAPAPPSAPETPDEEPAAAWTAPAALPVQAFEQPAVSPQRLSTDPQPDHLVALAPAPSPRSRFRGGWVWLPLSFIFLLLGVVLGFQIAIGVNTAQTADPSADPYLLDLSSVKFGENIHLKWSTESTAMRRAVRGILSIDDGGNTKIVELSREDLARGSVLYRHMSGSVRFRLEVYPRERNTVSESIDVRLEPEPAAAAPPKAAPRRNSRR